MNRIIEIVVNTSRFNKISVLTGQEEKQKTYGGNVSYFHSQDAQGVKKLLSESDVCIVPLSTIYMEALACNSLVLGGYFVENQEVVYNKVKETGYIHPIGDFNQLTVEKLCATLDKISLPVHIDNQVGRALPDVLQEIKNRI